MSDTYDVLRAQADDYAETAQEMKAVQAWNCWISLWPGSPMLKTIFVMRLVSHALGRRSPASYGESDGLTKPRGLKHKEQNSGTTGRASSRMLNFCFANH